MLCYAMLCYAMLCYDNALDNANEALAGVEARLSDLRKLMRRHGNSLETVLTFQTQALKELGDLDEAEEQRAVVLTEAGRRRAEAEKVAKELSAARHHAAARLGEAVSRELGQLGMGQASISFGFSTNPANASSPQPKITASGLDRGEFLMTCNPGEAPRPLKNVASGGELSRALLALKTVLSQLGPAGLYVFDEVDTGVGGAVAEAIGRKLAAVSRHHQVLCITHLPQIAVYADTHLVVAKEVKDGRTYSRIRRLAKKERVEEVARMIGGVEITEATRKLAAELLTAAAAAQSPHVAQLHSVTQPHHATAAVTQTAQAQQRSAGAQSHPATAVSQAQSQSSPAAVPATSRKTSPAANKQLKE
eukprot:g3399.t1